MSEYLRTTKLLFVTGLGVLATTSAVADSSGALAGWTVEPRGELTAYDRQSGGAKMLETRVLRQAGVTIDRAMQTIAVKSQACSAIDVQSAVSALGGKVRSASTTTGQLRCTIYLGRADTVDYFVIALQSAAKDDADVRAAALSILSDRLGLAAAPQQRVAPSTALKPAQAARPVATAAPGRLLAAIDKVVFRQGGDLDYFPSLLLRDGTAFDVGGDDIDTIDIAAARRDRPKRWSRWRQTGQSVTIGYEGRRETTWTLGEGLNLALPAPRGTTLNHRYKSVSGTMMDDMSMLNTRAFNFYPNGRFDQRSTFAASGSGNGTGVGIGGGSESQFSGRYTIDGHRITLLRDDGTRIVRFFAFSSGGFPPRIDRELIFIGGTTYVTAD